MPRYSYDMSKEQESNGQETFSEGWHDFEIATMEEMTSKQGNPMFKISLVLNNDPTKGITVYAITTQGKRWFLKQLLAACGCEAGQDGVYNFDSEDIIGKIVSGRIENSQEEWTDRNNKTRISTKSKVVEFNVSGGNDSEEDPFSQ